MLSKLELKYIKQALIWNIDYFILVIGYKIFKMSVVGDEIFIIVNNELINNLNKKLSVKV